MKDIILSWTISALIIFTVIGLLKIATLNIDGFQFDVNPVFLMLVFIMFQLSSLASRLDEIERTLKNK